ncbi:electron transporter RnfD [Paramagnetospirillum kuznetsovii]|uniref:Ion-translocating oxidoreductase complex subunit D n=1 Tax=Paramagnetospirillum kuznetsovii TaxID=2053833 RepID=A0A364NWV7_9PROT|nr:RnfABCDGE type electron transport complex subunit D [Paramagnetospirillum kuznetsovii]RAU21574.1 electron transporter RnfD [Paramagnetospirillum kuznetsovii]
MSILVDKSGPFTHGTNSVQLTMVTVLAALAPATLFNLYLFGWPAIFLFCVTMASCMAAEAACIRIAGGDPSRALSDGSVMITGWLLALSLPPWAPWWVATVASVFAVCLAKHAFGGLGQNVFNPAMVGRVVVLVSFPLQMTTFVPAKPLFSAQAPSFAESLHVTFGKAVSLDGISAASQLGLIKTELSRGIPVSQSMAHLPSLSDMMLGFHPGSMGETALPLILLGGLFLMWRKVISWHVPVAMLGTLFLLGTLFNAMDPARHASGWFHLISGASFLGAFFIATDYVTSPVSKSGQLAFGIGVGLLTWIIRTYAGYPEGVAFAVLLMNALTPILDQHFRPRVFGRTRKGEPLSLKGDK